MKQLGILTLILVTAFGLFGTVGCADKDDNKVVTSSQPAPKSAPATYRAPASRPATATAPAPGPARLGGNSIRVALPEGDRSISTNPPRAKWLSEKPSTTPSA